MKGKPMDPLGMGSLQFLSRVAVQRSCHSCWDTASSRAMDTRQAARVARAETRSKLSNSMVMEGEEQGACLSAALEKFFFKKKKEKKLCRSGSRGMNPNFFSARGGVRKGARRCRRLRMNEPAQVGMTVSLSRSQRQITVFSHCGKLENKVQAWSRCHR